MSEYVLEMKGISKSFNGIRVLNNVDFFLKQGEVHAILGGNGAGKSTFMKILTGVYQKDSGQIKINGQVVNFCSPIDAQRYGVAIIFQEFSLVPTLTVAQNIFLTREPRTSFGFLDDRECERQAREFMRELNVDIDPGSKVSTLGVGYWQLTEIAKALSQKPKILIMDEPTSSLTQSESESLFKLVYRLKEKGISIIYISHRLEEIFQICDRITVLRDGNVILTDNTSNLSPDTVIKAMTGVNLENAFEWQERKVNRSGPPVLEVRQLNAGHRVRKVSFRLWKGEILGIAGLMGSGRTELVRLLFGIDSKDGGEVLVNGQKVEIHSPQDAIRLGLALVPEDRRAQGLVLEHSVRENMLLPLLKKLRNKIFLDDTRGNSIVSNFIKRLNIKTDNMYKPVRLLSGGNQQKVVLAKWLANDPEILILDEPTIGIDVGAKSEIISTVRKLADEGKSIIVISSELAELLSISDRIIVLYQGEVIREMERKEIHTEEVLHHAIQGL